MLKADAQRIPLKSGSVALVFTSPPYNVGKDYRTVSDRLGWVQYRSLALRASAEIARVLQSGGRALVNVSPSVPHAEGSDVRVPLGAWWLDALNYRGLLYRDTIAWISMRGAGTAWGSWRSPSAPNLRGDHEQILVMFKGRWKRLKPLAAVLAERHGPGGDWTDITKNVWSIKPASRKSAHPTPFPDDLVRRAIRLCTWPGEIVLDPFGGEGTVERVAREMGRVGVSMDLHTDWVRHQDGRSA